MALRAPPGGLLLLAALLPGLCAFDYGSPILVSSEADVVELEYAGEIDEEMRDQLLDLLDEPLDLNDASRDDLALLPDVTYTMADRIIARRQKEPFRNVRELRDLVGRATWNQVKPFVLVTPVEQKLGEPVKGQVSVRYLDAFKDETFPVMYLKTREKYRKWLEAGLIVAEEETVYGVDYDAERAPAITVEGERPVVSLERVYLQAKRSSWSVLVGHYKVGFGQRLTFDVTDKQRPNGFSNDLKIYEDYEGYDSYSVPRRLLGVVASLRRPVADGGAWVEATAFASSNPQDLYYTYFSPHDYTVTGDGEVTYPTFPWVYREDILGANASYFWTKRQHVGVTAWGGHTWKSYDFDFTNTPIPNRPFYGAAGVDGAWGEGVFDVLGEVALTDRGGLGARVETVADPGFVEAKLAFRYYGQNFDNPHSRGQSEPDQFGYTEGWEDYEYVESGGDRDRNEIGPQAQVTVEPLGWLKVRAKGDLWHVPTDDVNHLYAEGRIDVDPMSWLGIDLVGYLRDKDIAVGGRDQTYDSSGDEDGKGSKLSSGVGLRLQPIEPIILQLFGKYNFEDSSSYDGEYMQDRYAWARLSWDVTESVELAGRFKLYDERVDTHESGKEYRSWYAQVRGRPFDPLTLFGRYEEEKDLDDPEADPNPERRLKLGVDYRF
ncbi:MAG: helix-hairpin-helix domain-containing protein [Pseudomonadota bacterium]